MMREVKQFQEKLAEELQQCSHNVSTDTCAINMTQKQETFYFLGPPLHIPALVTIFIERYKGQ